MKYLVLLLLLVAAPVAAQTHPCDLPIQVGTQSVVAGASFTLAWCHNGKDANGTNVSITGWKLVRNTDAPIDIVAIATPTKNSAGLTGYSVSRTEATAGTIIYSVYGLNGAVNGTPAAISFTVTVAVGPLTAPVNLRVVASP